MSLGARSFGRRSTGMINEGPDEVARQLENRRQERMRRQKSRTNSFAAKGVRQTFRLQSHETRGTGLGAYLTKIRLALQSGDSNPNTQAFRLMCVHCHARSDLIRSAAMPLVLATSPQVPAAQGSSSYQTGAFVSGDGRAELE